MLSRTGEKKYLAIDLGAESGRAILGRLNESVLTVEEVHRFPNEPVEYCGCLHWDAPRLWLEMQRALHKLHDTSLDGVAVDTWGVDYALLGEAGQLLQNPFHYRDGRTANMMEAVFQKVGRDEIYCETGIQFMPINTLYQLFSANVTSPRLVGVAERLLTMPDLFHYWLSGNAVCEYTNATTTQMVNTRTRQWATGLLERLGIPGSLPGPLVQPGTVIGAILPRVSQALSGTPVIAPASHDTGSAVAAVAARDDTAFISSGTWSLVGIEVDSPVITPQAQRLNFTNEGGVCGTTRLLKNVMGLWMLQGCRKSWATRGTTNEYRDLIRVAIREKSFAHLVDPDDARFLRPDDMLTAIDEFCRQTEQPTPATPGAYVRAVLESLALKYRRVLLEIEELTGLKIRQIRVIGGGSRNELLNQMTADATGKRVLAGPVEATALGNIGMQMLATGATSSIRKSREIIGLSYQTDVFEPYDTQKWEEQADLFEEYCEVRCA